MFYYMHSNFSSFTSKISISIIIINKTQYSQILQNLKSFVSEWIDLFNSPVNILIHCSFKQNRLLTSRERSDIFCILTQHFSSLWILYMFSLILKKLNKIYNCQLHIKFSEMVLILFHKKFTMSLSDTLSWSVPMLYSLNSYSFTAYTNHLMMNNK